MEQIVNRKRYNTETATLIAHDRYWDGHNWERNGLNNYLYKSKKGNFFVHHSTIWSGQRDSIEPISVDEAKEWYEKLREQEVSWEDAFGERPEEA